MSKKPKWMQGEYVPSNKEKYVGKYPINYKSGWELTFCRFCDNNQNILSWAYESIEIPYTHPFKKDRYGRKKGSIYIPDFLITYIDKNKHKYTEMIEIKPKSQVVLTEKSTLKEKIEISVNHEKWKAATTFCRHNDIKFRIITREELYVK